MGGGGTRGKQCEDEGRDRGDAATSQGIPEATRCQKKAKDSLLKSSEGAWPYSCTDALISTSGFQNGKRINRLFKASQSVGVVGSPGELRHRGFLEPVKKTA